MFQWNQMCSLGKSLFCHLCTLNVCHFFRMTHEDDGRSQHITHSTPEHSSPAAHIIAFTNHEMGIEKLYISKADSSRFFLFTWNSYLIYIDFADDILQFILLHQTTWIFFIQMKCHWNLFPTPRLTHWPLRNFNEIWMNILKSIQSVLHKYGCPVAKRDL